MAKGIFKQNRLAKQLKYRVGWILLILFIIFSTTILAVNPLFNEKEVCNQLKKPKYERKFVELPIYGYCFGELIKENNTIHKYICQKGSTMGWRNIKVTENCKQEFTYNDKKVNDNWNCNKNTRKCDSCLDGNCDSICQTGESCLNFNTDIYTIHEKSIKVYDE